MSFFHYQLGNNPLPGGNLVLAPRNFGVEHQGKFYPLTPKTSLVPTSETFFIVGPNTNLYYSDLPNKFGMQVIENNYPQAGRYNIPIHYQNKKIIIYQGYCHTDNYKDMFPGGKIGKPYFTPLKSLDLL